jgi:hypothetical protein
MMRAEKEKHIASVLGLGSLHNRTLMMTRQRSTLAYHLAPHSLSINSPVLQQNHTSALQISQEKLHFYV